MQAAHQPGCEAVEQRGARGRVPHGLDAEPGAPVALQHVQEAPGGAAVVDVEAVAGLPAALLQDVREMGLHGACAGRVKAEVPLPHGAKCSCMARGCAVLAATDERVWLCWGASLPRAPL